MRAGLTIDNPQVSIAMRIPRERGPRGRRMARFRLPPRGLERSRGSFRRVKRHPELDPLLAGRQRFQSSDRRSCYTRNRRRSARTNCAKIARRRPPGDRAAAGANGRSLSVRRHFVKRAKIVTVKELPGLSQNEAVETGRKMFEENASSYDGVGALEPYSKDLQAGSHSEDTIETVPGAENCSLCCRAPNRARSTCKSPVQAPPRQSPPASS